MTIYGTPGGTPNNISPFQGTTPGYNPAGNNLSLGLVPQVGLQPPAPNAVGGETVLAAISRGAIPINTLNTNEGVGQNTSIAAGLSFASDAGNQPNSAIGPWAGSAFSGGSDGNRTGTVGGGGGQVGDVTLIAAAPAVNITNQTLGGQIQYAG